MIKLSSRLYYLLIAVAAVVYVSLTFNTPTDPASVALYNFTPTVTFWFRITIIVPILFIWFAGAYAFTALSRYIDLIKASWEAGAFRKIRAGIGVIFWSSVVSSLINTLGTYACKGINACPDAYLSNYPLKPILVMTSNWFAVVPYLIGFAMIFYGTKILLTNVSGFKAPSIAWKATVGAFLALLAYKYLDLIFTNPARTTPTELSGGVATYYLPDSLIVLTLILPIFASWMFGILATRNLLAYGELVKGKIYQSFFSSLSKGLSLLIFLSIFLQSFTALGTERVRGFFVGLSEQSTNSALAAVLLLVYFIVLILGLAYLWLARGASKLSKIETA